MSVLWQDGRYALRQLRKSPGFAAVAILTLALGIGANTAIFSVVDAVLLRPLPYKDPGRLVWTAERFGLIGNTAVVVSPDFAGWKSRSQVFEQIAAYGGGIGANMTGGGEPVRVSVLNVTTDLFPMLGVRPVAGRMFTAQEGTRARNRVALLDEGLWRSRFSADPQIVGKQVQLDGTAYDIVGIMPAGLHYPKADVWTPLALDDQVFSPHSPRWTMLTVIGRLKPGIDAAQARADLEVIAGQMDREYPPQAAPFRANKSVEVLPLHGFFVQDVRSLLEILLGAAGFVLLVACANVANLLLARGMVRSREMAVRAVLGAARTRLVRQLLTEGLLLAAAGSVLGVVAGLGGTRVLEWLIPANLSSEIHLNPQILGFSVGIGVLTVLGFGFLPALVVSHTDISHGLKEGGIRSGSRPAARRLQGVTAITETALSLILLVGAGLLARSFVRLTSVDLGFRSNGALIATVQRPLTGSFEPQKHAAFFQQALDVVKNIPGVTGVALTSRCPLGPERDLTLAINVEGAEYVRPRQPVSTISISADYFRLLGIPILKGRAFSDRDHAGAPGTIIVNESLARMLFNGHDPLGKHISFGPPPAPWKEVVGVVADVRDRGPEQEPVPELFVPYLQMPTFGMTFVVEAKPQAEGLGDALRKAVRSVDPNQPLSEETTLDEVIAGSVAPRRLRMSLLGMFALLAFTLAAIGTYGVTSYFCSQRTMEFGVRVALGASRAEILQLAIWRGLGLTLAGVGIGVAGAFGLTRFIGALLYDVKPTDPLTFALGALALLGIAALACYIPAKRAANVDPMVALRYE